MPLARKLKRFISPFECPLLRLISVMILVMMFVMIKCGQFLR